MESASQEFLQPLRSEDPQTFPKIWGSLENGNILEVVIQSGLLYTWKVAIVMEGLNFKFYYILI